MNPSAIAVAIPTPTENAMAVVANVSVVTVRDRYINVSHRSARVATMVTSPIANHREGAGNVRNVFFRIIPSKAMNATSVRVRSVMGRLSSGGGEVKQ